MHSPTIRPSVDGRVRLRHVRRPCGRWGLAGGRRRRPVRRPARATILIIAVSAFLVGCGSERSPLGPTPQPTPAPTQTPTPTFTGSVTETLTGAPIADYSAVIVGGRVTISASGYVSRESRLNAP